MGAGERAYGLCWQYAGIVGVDPGPHTLAELREMARGRLESQWDQTAELLALIANTNRDPAKRARPFQAADFNRMRGRRKVTVTAENIGRLFGSDSGPITQPAPAGAKES